MFKSDDTTKKDPRKATQFGRDVDAEAEEEADFPEVRLDELKRLKR